MAGASYAIEGVGGDIRKVEPRLEEDQWMIMSEEQ